MGRMYSLVMNGSTRSSTTNLGFFYIQPDFDTVVVFHALYVSQRTLAGNANSENNAIEIYTASSVGSGTSAATARPLEGGTAAFSGTTYLYGSTGSPSEIVPITYHVESFNLFGGVRLIWLPENRPMFKENSHTIIKLNSTPVNAADYDVTLYFEEID